MASPQQSVFQSAVQNWSEVLRTQNLSSDRPMDPISRWLLIIRASVFPMTLTSGVIGGLLVVAGPTPVAANWGHFALASILRRFDGDTSVEEIVSVPSRNPLNTGLMTSAYGMRIHPVLGRRKRHKGIDLAAPRGTRVYATADGAIARADRSRTYGLVIYIDHGGDLETRYAHLSKLLVADGQKVKKGDLIGYVGSTGRSTGPHLHYEVRVEGVAVNPIPYMKDAETRSALVDELDESLGERKRPGVLTGQGGQ